MLKNSGGGVTFLIFNMLILLTDGMLLLEYKFRQIIICINKFFISLHAENVGVM